MSRTLSLLLVLVFAVGAFVAGPAAVVPEANEVEASNTFRVVFVSYSDSAYRTWNEHNRPRPRCYLNGRLLRQGDRFVTNGHWPRVFLSYWNRNSSGYRHLATINSGTMTWLCRRGAR